MIGALSRRLLGLDLPQVSRRQSHAVSTESAIALIAGLAFIAGLIHVGASAAHFASIPLYSAAFASVAAIQICWAVWVSRRPSRAALISGVVANVAVVALWLSWLTVGVHATQHVHGHAVYFCILSLVPGSNGGGVSRLLALSATLPELVIAAAATCLLLQSRSRRAARAVPALVPLLLAAMFLSVLYGVGAHA